MACLVPFRCCHSQSEALSLPSLINPPPPPSGLSFFTFPDLLWGGGTEGKRGPWEGEAGRRDSWARNVTPGVGPRVGPWRSYPEPALQSAEICIHLHTFAHAYFPWCRPSSHTLLYARPVQPLPRQAEPLAESLGATPLQLSPGLGPDSVVQTALSLPPLTKRLSGNLAPCRTTPPSLQLRGDNYCSLPSLPLLSQVTPQYFQSEKKIRVTPLSYRRWEGRPSF